MSDPVKDLIDHTLQDSEYLGMTNLHKMAEAADVANAQKDAVIEAARLYINSDDNMNVQRYENLVAALPAPATATPDSKGSEMNS